MYNTTQGHYIHIILYILYIYVHTLQSHFVHHKTIPLCDMATHKIRHYQIDQTHNIKFLPLKVHSMNSLIRNTLTQTLQ